MCGIFGISITKDSNFTSKYLKSTTKDIFLLSESRGKEASGLAFMNSEKIDVLKSPISASKMIRTKDYDDFFNRNLKNNSASGSESINQSITIIGHSRLATTGTQYKNINNQPVIAGNSVGIHNGIIVNQDELWNSFQKLKRHYEIDTEIIFSLIRMYYEESNSLVEAVQSTFKQIKGCASIAVLFDDLEIILLVTNNGSLYFSKNSDGNSFIFASEQYILSRLLQQSYIKRVFGEYNIQHIEAGAGYLINTLNLNFEKFSLNSLSENYKTYSLIRGQQKIIKQTEEDEKSKPLTFSQKNIGLSGNMDEYTSEYLEKIKKQFPHNVSWQDSLRRCVKCILPETMPFIEFDSNGVCNYCRNYRKLEFKGAENLIEVTNKYRRNGGDPDCIVAISGGRDSLFTLHYIKTILKMNPIAYTYDWGMVTDLARRNISRMCGKLGIEHILVSADLSKKRNYIKKNLSAWLKKPDLGMIPLFMAGDKQYFYYHYKVRKQTGIELAIQGENMLERTDFKSGFTGVRPYNKDPNHSNTLPLSSSFIMALFYGRAYLSNLSYINASLFDTIFAYACYYIIDRDYLNLYNYIPWIEEEVVSTLLNEYDFELANDTKTTWRIGDGTVAFYNYIYYNVAGFTENDTFRSNQIREGLINRDKALEQVREENKPRYESIHWYLNIIDLDTDMKKVLEIINAMPKVKPNGL